MMPSSVVTLRNEKLRQPASQCKSSIRVIRIVASSVGAPAVPFDFARGEGEEWMGWNTPLVLSEVDGHGPKTRFSAQHPLGDLLEHHLGGAAADRVDARVAHHAFDGALADIAEAAMELLAVIHHVVDQLAAIGLHHRDLAHAILAARIAPRGGIEQLASRRDAR